MSEKKGKNLVVQLLKIMRIVVKSAIVICAILWIWNYLEYHLTIQDTSAIDSLYIEFEGYIRENDFSKAYDLTSPTYKTTYNLESFVERFHLIQEYKELRLHPQRKLWFKDGKGWLFPKNFYKYGWNGVAFEFEKIEGKWYLTGEIQIFSD